MTYSDSIVAARSALTAFTNTSGFAALPDATKTAIYTAIGEFSPVTAVVVGMEALYAARADLDASGREVLCDCANQIANADFHGKAARSSQIIPVIRADAGEISLDPDAVIPDPDPAYA